MKSSGYWKKRFQQMEKSQHTTSAAKYNEIQKQMDKGQAAIQAKINAWYGRYATNNGISIEEARKQLTKSELKELKWDVNDYIKYGKENAVTGQWMKELENASARAHINRLEAIKLQIQGESEKLFGNVTDSVDSHIRDIFEDIYYHTAYEIQKGVGVGSTLAAVNSDKLNAIINKPWAVDEKNFVTRLGEDKAKLINNIHNSLTQMCLNGDNPKNVISQLASTMQGNKARAGRILRTESAYFSQVAQEQCFKDLDVEEYEIVATLDSRTCSDTCQGEDGKHYPMKIFQAGVTAPPFHPNCRCCTVPYFNDEWSNDGKRASRDEEGKTVYEVPANMTYEEWKEEYIIPESEIKDRFRFFSNNNKDNPKYYDYKGKSLDTVEKEISQFNYETAVIFDKNGKAISAQIGNEDTIQFTKYQCKLMNGADVTHNHPLGTPPSPEDLYLLVNYKGNSFRTCGKNGVYVLEYSEAIEELPDFDTFNLKYDELIKSLKDDVIKKYRDGSNDLEILIKLGETTWEELYKLYGVKPKFERL